MSSVIRIFFAIDLTDEIKEKVGRFMGSLKKQSKSHAIRWSKPENLHVTLQFLAEVQQTHLQNLVNHVRAEISKVAMNELRINLGNLHIFPNPYRPRVIVLEVNTEDNALSFLSECIGHGILASGYDVENRPFRGHLTLGRIKQPQGFDLSFLAGNASPHRDTIAINEIVLFRSDPQPEGSKYTVIERIPL